MKQVFIDPTKTTISVQVSSQSLHAVGFNVSVFESDGNTVREQHSGNTQATNPATVSLGGTPGSYKGTYISGTFTIISPNGNDGPYALTFSILLDGGVVSPSLPISGTTTGGQDTAVGNFHLN